MSDEPKPRFNYLSVIEIYNLNVACIPLNQAYKDVSFGVFQVGSSLVRSNYRDVDLRMIMRDEDYDKLFGDDKFRLRLLNVAISEWLQTRTGLPIDFQFQRQSNANAEFGGQPRNGTGHKAFLV